MKLPAVNLSEQTKKQLSSAVWTTLGVIVLIFVAEATAGIFYRGLSAGRGLIHIAISLLGLRYFLRSFGLSLKDCGITRPKLGFTDIGLILLILGVFSGLILSFPGHLVWSGLSREVSLGILSAAFYVGIKSPVVEELLFRGFLFKMHHNYWGRATAVLITSLVFTLIHIRGNLNPQQQLWHLTMVFLGSLLFAFLRLYDGHVWGCVLLHSVWNIVLGHAFLVKIDAEIREAFFTYLIDPSLVTDQQQRKLYLGYVGILLLAIAFVLAALYLKKRKSNQRA